MADEKKKYLVGLTHDCAIQVATVGGQDFPKRDKFGVGTLALLTDAEHAELLLRIKGQGFYIDVGGRPIDCKVEMPGCERLEEYAFIHPWSDTRDQQAEPATIAESEAKPVAEPEAKPEEKKEKASKKRT